MKNDMGETLRNSFQMDEQSRKAITEAVSARPELYHSNFFVRTLRKYTDDKAALKNVYSVLAKNNLSTSQRKDVLNLVKNEISLNRRIERLQLMQNLFKYWHVAHLPFALVMLVIMVIHVAVTLVFGYRWIF